MMSVDSSGSLEVFYSYAENDEALRNELEKHLGAIKRLNLIRDWHHRDVQIGTDWMQAVDVHLDSAQIILLLISADFISSDYCYSVEMQRALERHRQGKARVVPIILRPVDLEGTPIASLYALPTGGKPITNWPDRDAAFTDVARGIRKVIQELKDTTPRNEVKIGSNASTQNSASPANKVIGTTHQEISSVPAPSTAPIAPRVSPSGPTFTPPSTPQPTGATMSLEEQIDHLYAWGQVEEWIITRSKKDAISEEIRVNIGNKCQVVITGVSHRYPTEPAALMVYFERNRVSQKTINEILKRRHLDSRSNLYQLVKAIADEYKNS